MLSSILRRLKLIECFTVKFAFIAMYISYYLFDFLSKYNACSSYFGEIKFNKNPWVFFCILNYASKSCFLKNATKM